MKNRKILVMGSIAYDFIMNYSGNMNETISSDPNNQIFNLAVMPETKYKSFGGTAGNIGYNLSLLGASAGLITSVGKDFVDLGYQDRINNFHDIHFEGIVHPDLFTATCYIVNDKNKNQLIIFHQGAMVRGEEINLKQKYPEPRNIKIASISPDYCPAMIKWAHELHEMKIPFIFDPGQVTPEFQTTTLKDLIPKAFLLIGNEYEISMILRKMQYTKEQLLELNPNLIITKGVKGSECHYHGKMFHVPICKPSVVEDPTGAGDGYRAGLLYALARDLPFDTACKLGSVVGSFVVEKIGPQSQEFTPLQVKDRFKMNFLENITL